LEVSEIRCELWLWPYLFPKEIFRNGVYALVVRAIAHDLNGPSCRRHIRGMQNVWPSEGTATSVLHAREQVELLLLAVLPATGARQKVYGLSNFATIPLRVP